MIEIRDGEIVRNPPAIEKVNATGGTEPVVNTASGWRQFVSGFNEALTMAWRALAANKMRTLLTMLGIIIGIASVVSIVVVATPPNKWCWRIFVLLVRILLMSIRERFWR